ncbi:hypothetical protein CDL12_29978 [Handroanthus impetiginosus]|uniref:Uncharacterized protein n=1 Tax=Handroanthus impetiginosus TaxID=429701 RepID=A0A2G9FWX7_9LAMI|nr:hypothetical protein CDL12_29978 [Handroanthus impetiginosus]
MDLLCWLQRVFHIYRLPSGPSPQLLCAKSGSYDFMGFLGLVSRLLKMMNIDMLVHILFTAYLLF